jgi:hypothetical protein
MPATSGPSTSTRCLAAASAIRSAGPGGLGRSTTTWLKRRRQHGQQALHAFLGRARVGVEGSSVANSCTRSATATEERSRNSASTPLGVLQRDAQAGAAARAEQQRRRAAAQVQVEQRDMGVLLLGQLQREVHGDRSWCRPRRARRTPRRRGRRAPPPRDPRRR